MTRPLWEPSTPREVAGNSWGVSQLQRRPAEAAAAGAFHGWAVQMSTSAINDSNTYFNMFGFGTTNLWFDTTVCDTDGYLQVGADPADGSYIVIPQGLGGLYTVTFRMRITADTPLVSASTINLSPTDSTQYIKLFLDPDMIDAQVDEWSLHLTGLFQIDETEFIVAGMDFATLTNPGIYVGGGNFYTSMMGVYHGPCSA